MLQKKSTKELNNNDETKDVEIATPKKRYISPEERKQIIEELMLVPKSMYELKLALKKTTNYLQIKASIII